VASQYCNGRRADNVFTDTLSDDEGISIVLYGSGFSSIGSVSVQFWIKAGHDTLNAVTPFNWHGRSALTQPNFSPWSI